MRSFGGEGSLKDHIGSQGGGQDGPKKDHIIFECSLRDGFQIKGKMEFSIIS